MKISVNKVLRRAEHSVARTTARLFDLQLRIEGVTLELVTNLVQCQRQILVSEVMCPKKVTLVKGELHFVNAAK